MEILFAAAIATIASLLIIGGYLLWRSDPTDWRILGLLVLSQLAVSPTIFFGIRLPLDWVLEQCVENSQVRRTVSVFLRPVFEELAKLWPLLLPIVARTMTDEKKLLRGVALGLGFGIGELWLLAGIVFRNDPVTSSQSLWSLVGFINERMMVCAIHGVLTVIALRSMVTGFPMAVGLHAVGNLPFYLQEISTLGLRAQTWGLIFQFWVMWYFFGMVSLFWTMSGGDLHLVWLLFGDATCPYCGMIYPRATLSWNLRVIHHDHCPRCKARNVMQF